jgi:hypothetical protein
MLRPANDGHQPVRQIRTPICIDTNRPPRRRPVVRLINLESDDKIASATVIPRRPKNQRRKRNPRAVTPLGLGVGFSPLFFVPDQTSVRWNSGRRSYLVIANQIVGKMEEYLNS